MTEQYEPDKPKNDEGKRPGGARRIVMLVVFASLGLCVMCALLGAGIAYVTVRLTQPAADAGSAFLQALAAEDYEAAYAQMTSDLQTEFDGAAGLQAQMQARNIDPQRWTWNSRDLNNNTAEVRSTVTMANGDERATVVYLRWDGEQWRVAAFSFD